MEKLKNIVGQYINSYNNFNVEGMLLHLDENVVFQNISNEEITLETKGVAAFKNQAESAINYFSERKQTITAITLKENTVFAEIDYKGILAIDLPNGLKVGEELALKGTSEFTFENDKIVGIVDRS